MSTCRRRAAPESPRQAQWWGILLARYLRAGLCRTCAAQAAYGHQHGRMAVEPPCDGCRPVLDLFPLPQVNGWRSLPPHGAQTDRGTTTRSTTGVLRSPRMLTRYRDEQAA